MYMCVCVYKQMLFVAGSGNPFTSPNRHSSPSITPTPNPFSQPAPAVSSRPITGSPATVNAASNHDQPSYPTSFNPFLWSTIDISSWTSLNIKTVALLFRLYLFVLLFSMYACPFSRYFKSLHKQLLWLLCINLSVVVVFLYSRKWPIFRSIFVVWWPVFNGNICIIRLYCMHDVDVFCCYKSHDLWSVCVRCTGDPCKNG